MLLFRSKIDSVAIRTFSKTFSSPHHHRQCMVWDNGKTENHTSILTFIFVQIEQSTDTTEYISIDRASFYIHKQINANVEYPKRKYQITAVDMILNNIIQNIYQVPLNCTIRELCAIYRRTCTIIRVFSMRMKANCAKSRAIRKNVNINRHTHTL